MAKKPAISITPTPEQNALITSWLDMKKAAAHFKEEEMEKRKAVVAALFPNGADEGTNNVELGKGWTLRYVNKQNYKLGMLDDVDAALDEIRAIGNEGSFIADRLVKFTPELSLTEYRALTDPTKSTAVTVKVKEAIDRVLTISPASPELELKEPK